LIEVSDVYKEQRIKRILRIVAANANSDGFIGLAAMNNLINPQEFRQKNPFNPFNPLYIEPPKVE